MAKLRGEGISMSARFLCALVITCALSSTALAQSVVIKPTSDGVTAAYSLDRDADHLRFADPGLVRTDWFVVEPGVTLAPEGVQFEGNRRDFLIDVRPDSTEDGRGYIALTRLDEGYILYAPAFTADDAVLNLSADLPSGWTLQPQAPFDGYVFLGPTALVQDDREGPVRISAGSEPSVAAGVLLESFDQAVDAFSRVFGQLPRPPVIAITEQGAGPAPLRGDVTDSGMVSIRLHGDLGDLDDDTRQVIRYFAFHEAAHLWNSHLAKPVEGAPWLHEGGAHYLGLAAAASAGHLDQTQVLSSLSQYLTDCRRDLAERADVFERISMGASAYNCGAVIQWLVDIELKQAQGTDTGVFSVWSRLIDRARQGRPEYEWADFKASLPSHSAAEMLLEGDPAARWAELEIAMDRLGVRWVNQPSSASLVSAVLRHLKRQACGGGLSYTVRSGAVEMDNGPDCGPISGTLTLATIEGFDPLSQTAPMFDAVQDKCGRREAVAVVLAGELSSVSISCEADVLKPISYAITKAPSVIVPAGA